MKVYLIKDALVETDMANAMAHTSPYVAIATGEEFYENSKFFDMGIDLDLDLAGPTTTNAEVNYDSIIGTFNIPDRKDINGENHKFAFALDEKGIVFVNDDGYVEEKLGRIIKTKKWRFPSLERFIFDFLEQITDVDLALLENMEVELDKMEDDIHKDLDTDILDRLAVMRGNLQDLRLNYEQLLDVAQEFEENENNFFKDDNLRFFSLYSNRIKGLLGILGSVREHAIEVRDLYRTALETKQNHMMAVLTLIATIFMPLTLIVGWYGMNFVHMPELAYKYSYPIVIAVCLLIVAWCIFIFKKKKWL